MSNVNCPTCKGTGKVTAEEAVVVYETREKSGVSSNSYLGQSCSCDGPPHAWAANWCPASGPVTNGRR